MALRWPAGSGERWNRKMKYLDHMQGKHMEPYITVHISMYDLSVLIILPVALHTNAVRFDICGFADQDQDIFKKQNQKQSLLTRSARFHTTLTYYYIKQTDGWFGGNYITKLNYSFNYTFLVL